MEIRNHLQEDHRLYTAAPGFFTLIHESLTIDLMVSLTRLYEEGRSERNLPKFLNVVEMNLTTLSSLDPQIDVSVVNAHRVRIKELKGVLDNLTVHRDRLLVHHDKEYFLDPRRTQRDAPISFGDLETLLKTAEEILRTYYPALLGAAWARGLLEARDVREVFRALRSLRQGDGTTPEHSTPSGKSPPR